jgi:hypothetical protein
MPVGSTLERREVLDSLNRISFETGGKSWRECMGARRVSEMRSCRRFSGAVGDLLDFRGPHLSAGRVSTSVWDISGLTKIKS